MLNLVVIEVGVVTKGSLILCLLLVISIFTTPVTAQDQVYEEYVDPGDLFTIEYPSDWELIGQSGDDYVGYMSFNLRDKVTDELMYASISVQVKEEPEQLETLQDLRRNVLLHPDAVLSKAENPVIEPATLSGQEAFRLSFHSPPLSLCDGCEAIIPALEGIRVVTFDPETKFSYTVELSSPPVLSSELVPNFETSVDSFQITEVG